MKTQTWLTVSFAGAFLLLFSGIVLAGPPSWAGGGNDHGDRKDRREFQSKRKSPQHGSQHEAKGRHFTVYETPVVRHVYPHPYGFGWDCPPGLAKKHNGCRPPGMTKHWVVGYPLPTYVVYEPVPSWMILRLGPPGPGYEYVRVAGDILKIAIGTNLVVNAIQDLGGR